ncbi:hypothetical protein AGMMS49959_01870 [Planctomycetales bacterium]|nr:hypothetical protein AGMMS49959_01870 [Planctomycetales bacterium]
MSATCPYCQAVQIRPLAAGQEARCEGCARLFTVAAADKSRPPTTDRACRDATRHGVTPADEQMLFADAHKIIGDIPRVAKYIVGEEIAKGGMGKVLEAHDPHIRREIAVKILGTQPTDEDLARFLQEAQLTGQLEHPNIVPVHDLGFTADGKLFFVMKRVRGKSLEEVLDLLRLGDPPMRAAFSLSRLLQILEAVCSAVAYAHARGVIHRDLKPANIMLGDFGEVLVMDWGLAKSGNVRQRPLPQFFNPADTAPRLKINRYRATMNAATQHLPEVNLPDTLQVMRNNSRLWGTRRGTVAGTPAYMSPEQARGDLNSLDERSDIYALGSILYEILTGVPPVLASTESAMVSGVIQGNILAPSARSPHRPIPDELSRIAMKALKTAPGERYQSALDFQSDLRAFLDGVTVFDRESHFWETAFRLVRHYKLASFFTGWAFAALVASGVWFYQQQQATHDLTRRDLATAQARLEAETAKQEAARLRAPLEYEAANTLLEQNRFAAARQHLQLALTYDPNFRPARLKNAELFLLEQNYRAALDEAQMLLDQNPADASARRVADQARRGLLEVGAPPAPEVE